MKFLKAAKVIMDCDLKGNYRRRTLGLSFYFCLAFDAEELMHIAEEKSVDVNHTASQQLRHMVV